MGASYTEDMGRCLLLLWSSCRATEEYLKLISLALSYWRRMKAMLYQCLYPLCPVDCAGVKTCLRHKHGTSIAFTRCHYQSASEIRFTLTMEYCTEGELHRHPVATQQQLFLVEVLNGPTNLDIIILLCNQSLRHRMYNLSTDMDTKSCDWIMWYVIMLYGATCIVI